MRRARGVWTIMADTLCWRCDRACGLRQCRWALQGIPVPGWYAEETRIRTPDNRYIGSYRVIACPEYIPDRVERREEAWM